MRFKPYRDALQLYADDFQRRINRDCVKNRGVLNDIFDKWVVWIDPNIFNPRQRETATEAHTNFNNGVQSWVLHARRGSQSRSEHDIRA
jgi:hypothetical protein